MQIEIFLDGIREVAWSMKTWGVPLSPRLMLTCL